MSGGGRAHVQLANHSDFTNAIVDIAKHPTQLDDFTATMIIDGEIRQGWKIQKIDLKGPHDHGEKYPVILRHSIDSRLTTAEYVCIFVDGHGGSIKAAQCVVIQNDKDYGDESLERFWILTHSPLS
jgi:hypothetical protein